MVDGIDFDSKKEANRYQELQLLLKAKKIQDLQLQVPYELIPAQYEYYGRISDKTGKRLKDGRRCLEKACTYVADFVYLDCVTGELVVEDAKGMRTKDYVIKRKLMLYRHGIKVREI